MRQVLDSFNPIRNWRERWRSSLNIVRLPTWRNENTSCRFVTLFAKIAGSAIFWIPTGTYSPDCNLQFSLNFHLSLLQLNFRWHFYPEFSEVGRLFYKKLRVHFVLFSQIINSHPLDERTLMCACSVMVSLNLFHWALVSSKNVDSGQTQIESLPLTYFGRFSLKLMGWQS